MVLFTVVAHILELAINEINLLVRETEGLSVDQLFQHLQLIYYQSLPVVMDRVLDLVQVLTKHGIFQRIRSSLLGSQVQYGTAYLEQILGNIFRLTAKLPGISIDVKVLPLLLK